MTAASTSNARPRSRSATGARPSSRSRASSRSSTARTPTRRPSSARSRSTSRRSTSGKDGVEATASDNLSARLPYMFAVSRFAHYLKCMVRDKIGSTKEKEAAAALAAGMDQRIRRRRSGQFDRGDEGAQAARGRARRRLRERGESGLLLGALLSAPALPARGNGHRPQPRVAASAPQQLRSIFVGATFALDRRPDRRDARD